MKTVNILGHQVEITGERTCRRSDTDHIVLRNEARVARQKDGFDVDQSYVLCTRCGLAVELKV